MKKVEGSMKPAEAFKDSAVVRLPGRKRILVVDDDELNRKVLGGFIDQFGHEPLYADSGPAALGELDDNVDLILLDVLMPGMDGYELARRIRESPECPDVPIIMVTTLKDSEDRLAAIKAGANDFLNKPVDRTELEVRMNSLLKMREAQKKSRSYHARLESSVKALRKVRDTLELRVRERTRDLEELNSNLRREIKEKHSAQLALQLFEEVFRNSLQGIAITDAEGKIVKVNSAFESITGYVEAEALGKNPRALKSSQHGPEFYEKMWRDIQEKGRWSGEIWNRRKNGQPYPEWLNIVSIKDDEGKVTHYAGIFHDLTEIKEKEEKIHFHVHHDALTGLPNRYLFAKAMSKEIERANQSNRALSVLYLDLDNFKRVNDCLGHHAGDRVLREIAGRLGDRLEEDDVMGKLSGDDFAFLVGGYGRGRHITEVVQDILSSFHAPVVVEGQEIYITASIGIAVYPADGSEDGDLLKNAEIAMYRAKELGKNGFSFFTEEMNRQAGERLMLEGRMRQALHDGDFEVFMQPKYSADMAITGMEALVRWRAKNGEVVSPGKFIPLAEENGLIVPLGEKVLRKACRHTAELIAQGYGDLKVSVNLSPRQFMQENLREMVAGALEDSGLPPGNLELEITETSIMADIVAARQKLVEISGLGVSLSIDDFGTGYSSLYYLKHFPIDALKIDRSFIRDLATDINDATIVKTIIGLAKNFKLRVVAEGVETDFQLKFLKDNGCEEFQGFLLGKPMPLEDFKAFIPKRGRKDLCSRPATLPLRVKDGERPVRPLL